MKHIQFLGTLALMGCFTVSCANRNKVASNPYQSNPYYTGTSSASSESSEPAGAAEYPTYNDSTPSYDSANTVEYPTYSNEPEYPTYSSQPVEAPAPLPEPVNNNPYSSTYENTTPTYDPPAPVHNTHVAGRTHVVAQGENLYRISLKYGTSVSAIQNANSLGNSTIFPGQVLQIP